VVQHKAGQILVGYGGLYITNFKLGLMDEAEESFGRMVVVGIENGVLPIKFMFASNSTDFLEDPDLKKQYEIWLRQISLYFKEHPKTCLLIVGHTSLSGSDNANKKLSLQRAQAIQLKMQQIFQDITELSSTEGKGSEETIVGTSPDDEQNSIDRRVEFKIANCGATSK
jgi:outer membrane protein OmpA-like peptidoglycan-associated protein